MSDSLKDFLREAIQDHDDGASLSDAPTVVATSPVSKSEMGALPGHEVQGFIARGGMGAIYLARQQALEREVAVKVMTAEAGSAEMAERFRREALVLGRLAHPNIVPVYDISMDDEGQLFYTMKLVKGRTLQHIINDLRSEDPAALRTHTLASLLTVFRKVCDALAFAHSQGIIHRDLKPENVMVGEFGEVLVMDWGLAKKLSEKTETPVEASPSSMMIRRTDFGGTLSGSVMGTPQYMSPEQAMGLVSELDARSDIFSLGGILYAILTLRPPVEGSSLEDVLEKVRMGSIASPSAFGTTREGTKQVKGAVLEARKIMPLPHVDTGKVPPALSAVVMKALRLDKALRYQSVAEFSADIEAYQGGFATTAEQAGLGKQIVLLMRRNKGIFITAAVAWVVITALAVWFVLNLHAKEQRAIAGEEAAKASEAAAVLEKEAARQSSAIANINVADAALREGDSITMRAALNAVPDDLRDSTWGYLLDQSDTSISRLRSSATNEILGVAAHPRRPGVFAVGDAHLGIALLDVRNGARLQEFKVPAVKDGTETVSHLAFSPDGERLAASRGGGGIVVHGAQDGKVLTEWKADPSLKLEFSADGRLLLQQGSRNGKTFLMVWDSTNGQLLWKHAPKRGSAFGTFTPDGQHVVAIARGSGLQLLSAQDGAVVRSIAGLDAASLEFPTSALALGGNDLLALADERLTITVVNWKEGRLVCRFQHEAAAAEKVDHLAWTPDGAQIVTAMLAQDGRQLIRVWNARTGSLMRSLLGGSRAVKNIAVHPLSGELVVTGGRSSAWKLTGALPKWTISASHATSVVFWGSDDVVVATAPPKSKVSAAVQKLGAGDASVLWTPDHLGYSKPAVSADGQWASITYPRGKKFVLLRRTGDEVKQVAVHGTAGQADFVRLSPKGDFAAAFSTSNVQWFASVTGKEQPKLEREGVRYFRDAGWLSEQRLVALVTAKARRLEAGSEEWIVLWDTSTGKVVQTTVSRGVPEVLAVEPGGKRFAEAGSDKRVRVRDGATLAILQEFRAHDGAITALAWHPSRPILATASTDLCIRLWDLDTGRRLEELRGATQAPHQLSFSPSGHLLGAASPDDDARIWEPQSLQDKTKPAAGDWEDLLAPLTPATVAQTGGGWRMDNGVLYSPNKKRALLPLSDNLRDTSYQLRVKLRQLESKNFFYLALPVAGRTVGFAFEVAPEDGCLTGFSQIDGKSLKDLPYAVRGKLVKDAEQHDLEVTVRLNGDNVTLSATLDDKPLCEWSGHAAALNQHPDWNTPQGTLMLSTYTSDWVVHDAKLKRL